LFHRFLWAAIKARIRAAASDVRHAQQVFDGILKQKETMQKLIH
jgi:hypothetical protein